MPSPIDARLAPLPPLRARGIGDCTMGGDHTRQHEAVCLLFQTGSGLRTTTPACD
jgi:hypothetical protein